MTKAPWEDDVEVAPWESQPEKPTDPIKLPPSGVSVLTGQPTLPGGFERGAPAGTGMASFAASSFEPIAEIPKPSAEQVRDSLLFDAKSSMMEAGAFDEKASQRLEAEKLAPPDANARRIAGIGSTVVDALNFTQSPAGIATSIVLPIAPTALQLAAGGLFATQGAIGAHENYEKLKTETDPQERGRLASQMILDSLMVAAPAAHAYGAYRVFDPIGDIPGFKPVAPRRALDAAAMLSNHDAPVTATILAAQALEAPKTPVVEPVEKSATPALATPETQPEAAKPAETAANQPYAEVEGGIPHGKISVSEIAAKPDLMQFKRNDAADGTNNNERIAAKQWDVTQEGRPLLWEPNDPAAYGLTEGQKYIIADGHHRLEFANRIGHPHFEDAQILREADGYSATDAMVKAAENNIVTGRGTIYDRAKFLRNTAATHGADEAIVRAKEIGVSGRNESSIAFSATEPTYNAFINKRIGEKEAAAIARAAPNNEAAQVAGMRSALAGNAPDIAANRAKVELIRPDDAPKQVDLFGNEVFAEQDAQAERATQIQRGIREQIRAVEGAAKKPELAKKLGVNVSDPEGVRKRVTELRGELERWENWTLHPDLVEQTRGEVPVTTPNTEVPKTPAGIEVVFDNETIDATESLRDRFDSKRRTAHVFKFPDDKPQVLYRGISEQELKALRENPSADIMGGKYSAPIEREFGAQYSLTPDEAVRAAFHDEQHKGVKGQPKYLLKVDARGKTFSHLDPRPTTTPELTGKGRYVIPADRISGDLGVSTKIPFSDVLEVVDLGTAEKDARTRFSQKPAPETPKLKPSQNQGDLLSVSADDPFNLVSETSADKAAREAREAKEQASKDAAAKEKARIEADKAQTDMFAPQEPKAGENNENSNAGKQPQAPEIQKEKAPAQEEITPAPLNDAPTTAVDTQHLDALNLRLSHERGYLEAAKTEKERQQRRTWIKQIEKEIADERKFIGLPDAPEEVMSDEELLAALNAPERPAPDDAAKIDPAKVTHATDAPISTDKDGRVAALDNDTGEVFDTHTAAHATAYGMDSFNDWVDKRDNVTLGHIKGDTFEPSYPFKEHGGDPLTAEQQTILDFLRSRTPDQIANDVSASSNKPLMERLANIVAKERGEPTDIPPGHITPGASTGADIPDPKVTSIKNAQIDKERVARGLEPMMAAARKSMPETWDEAMDVLERDPSAGIELIRNLRYGAKKEVNAVDQAMLLHEHIRAMNERDMEMERTLDEHSSPEEREEARLRFASLEDHLNDIDEAARKAGTLAGRSLQFRQAMMRDDYTFAAMERRKRASKGGQPLTLEESATIKQQSDRIAELEKQLSEHLTKVDGQNSDAALDDSIKSMSKEADIEITPRVASLAERVVQALEREADKARARLREKLFSRASAGVDPTILYDLAVVGASHIARGALEFTRWSAEMVKDFGEDVKPYLQDAWTASNDHLENQVDKMVSAKDRTKVKAKVKPTDLPGQRDAIATAMKEKAGDETTVRDFQFPIQKLARNFVRQGIRERQALVDAVHSIVKEIVPSATPREVMDAISGYGDFKPLTSDDVSVALRDLKGQMQQVGKIEDMQAGKAPSKTGMERRSPSDEERRLIKEVNDLKKRGGFTVTDPATQLKTALGAIKTRLRNQISDLEFQIADGKKLTREKSGVPYDEEATQLKARRDELKKQFDDVFGKPGLTDEQRIKIAGDRLEKSIADYEQRISDAKAGKFGSPKTATKPSTPALDALTARRDALRAEYQELRSLDTGLQEQREARQIQNSISELQRRINENDLTLSNPKQPLSTPVLDTLRGQREALKQQLMSLREDAGLFDQQRISRTVDGLKQSIAEYDRRLQTGNLTPKPQTPAVETPEIERLRAERDAMQKFYRELQNANKPRKSPEEIALAGYKTRTTNRIADLQDRITRGDFSPTKRRSITLDSEALRLQAEANRVKEQFEQARAKDRLARRTPLEKAQDTFVKWRRGFILSAPTVLAKLTTAAFERMAFTPVEELIGGGISKIIPGIASRAPREGGLNIAAEAKALTDGLTKGMKDGWDVLTKGKSELELNYGKRTVLPRTAIDFLGSIHGALKTTAKRAEFSRSFEKRAAHAMANGVDATDPAVQMRIAMDAYKDANRSIFLQDNRVVAAYKRGLSAFDQPDKSTGRVPVGSKIISTTARALLPVVKVPTNIVAETMQYAVGSVTGSARLAFAMRRGVGRLAPEEADLIMRDLKKGTLGAALLTLGYLDAKNIGGYYQPGARDPKDVKFGTVRVAGANIPSYVVHNPLLECLQLGATIRRVADSKFRKSDTQKQGISAGVLAGAFGLYEETPFLRNMVDVSKLFDPRERGAFLGELSKSFVVPQFFQWWASKQDTDASGNTIKRDPQTIGEHIKTGIPGLRQTVPKKKTQRRTIGR